MEKGPTVKEQLRKLSDKDWLREMRERAKRREFKPWIDLITVKEYQSALGNYLGGLDTLADKKYLDIGAGFGSKLHEFLQQQGAEITNVDIAPASIEFLKKKRRESGVVADIFKLAETVEENSLDGVIALNLINYLGVQDREDLDIIFKQVHRVLKDGGCFIQSHSGFIVRAIPINEQLAAAGAAGFDNIQLIQSTRKSKPAYPEPLTFIAQKKAEKK